MSQQEEHPADDQLPIKAPPVRLSLLGGIMASVADNEQYLYRGGALSMAFGFSLGFLFDAYLLHSVHGSFWVGGVGALAVLIVSCALAGVVVLLQGGVKSVNSNVAHMAHKVMHPQPEAHGLKGALSTPVDPMRQGTLELSVEEGELSLIHPPEASVDKKCD